MKAPVFVLGHWRSGTTYLHNLLAADPAHAFPTTYECTFPGGFLLSEKPLGWSLSLFLPRTRPMDDVPVGRDRPFEDEFALAKLGAPSPYRALAFPRAGGPAVDTLDVERLPLERRRLWDERVLWLMRRLQLAHPDGRLVLKSPTHTARMGALLRLFPDARFVHIARDPFRVYPSTINLWRVMNSRLGLENPANDEGWLPEHVLATLPVMYEAYERDCAALPPGRLHEIRYEDLVDDTEGTLAGVYEALGLGDFGAAWPGIARYVEGLGAHEERGYPLAEADRAAISQRWGFYFDRFGYARHDG